MIKRYSSRLCKLDQSFLVEKLKNAKAYDRIAGYFSSSILEIAGEAIESMEGAVRIVCNYEVESADVITAAAAQNAIRREWCGQKPEELLNFKASGRFKKLYELLIGNKIQVKVLPKDIFGFIHGKAGIITLSNGEKTSFIGSVNETYSGWKSNYELAWEDNSPEAIQWVQDEFDSFWNHPQAIPLSEFIIDDIKRLSERQVINTIDEWRQCPEPASPIIESPVYREELGLWEHQKYFIKLIFDEHQKPYGARYILADTVGLGKTVQLAISAQLMALYGDKPILVIVPKTLLWQWQEELNDLLDMPSAVWNGREWIDENNLKYPCGDNSFIKKCPRRIGIISQGLITAGSDTLSYLLGMEYDCIIVDEAHRARRKNLGPGKENQKPDPNNLMKFLIEISPKTKSMLLATATPVQLYPIEAWDLAYILSQANQSVLGSKFSKWITEPIKALNLIAEKEKINENSEIWEWVRNPFPPADEDERTFRPLREHIGIKEHEFVIAPETYEQLRGPIKSKLERIIEDNFITHHNPFIRHIVRRTREHLENTINPETNEPYLKKVKVKLFGEDNSESIILTPYLEKAYKFAEEFCALLQKRVRSGGFIKTLLLRRTGSSIHAGLKTAEKMLKWSENDINKSYEDDIIEEDSIQSELKNLTDEEQACLNKFIQTLKDCKERDPKYDSVHHYLIGKKWITKGCIIFSQYYDSVKWIADTLSKELTKENIGIYAGGGKSGVYHDGIFQRRTKEEIKKMVKEKQIRLLIGTDSASEGLNLQTLGTLINLDLPWNPTRLEQRKGRIQRIGQMHNEILIYNMRYKDSVEDKVHNILSGRLENIYSIFGQLPDILEDVWVDVALNDIEEARRKIGAIPAVHPFSARYQENVNPVHWETCSKVLNKTEKRKYLMNGWNGKNKE